MEENYEVIETTEYEEVTEGKAGNNLGLAALIVGGGLAVGGLVVAGVKKIKAKKEGKPKKGKLKLFYRLPVEEAVEENVEDVINDTEEENK